MGRDARRWKRRSFLSLLAAWSLRGASGRGERLPSHRTTYRDAATEFQVIRLTDPSYSSFLPASYGRFASRRRNFLLFWSDRTGSPQAFRMTLPGGEWEQLTDAAELDGASISILPDERSFCYFDGAVLRQASLSTLRGREIYRVPDGWRRGKGFSVTGDGVQATFVEVQGDTHRLRLVGIAKGEATTVVEVGEVLSEPQPRPRRAAILYRRAERIWLAGYDGSGNKPVETAPGGLGPALWAPDGRTVFYLSYPQDSRALHAIREATPDANSDALVSPTSQFVNFGENPDASVFVGASGSKASPYVLLLLRVARRELTLCEHRASDPASVCPVFSPDSQQVYFQSDRDGKAAIYSIQVDKLVAKTDT